MEVHHCVILSVGDVVEIVSGERQTAGDPWFDTLVGKRATIVRGLGLHANDRGHLCFGYLVEVDGSDKNPHCFAPFLLKKAVPRKYQIDDYHSESLH